MEDLDRLKKFIATKMTEQLHQLSSPSQMRVADAMINWATSPSPFGYEGLLSMEMGSPFLQFSPISFGAGDSEHPDAVTVFSPSMFSPSKSKVNVTSRLLKKREVCTSNPFQCNDNNEINLSRISTLKFEDSNLSTQASKEDDLARLPPSHASSFICSTILTAACLPRDIAIVGGYELVPTQSVVGKRSSERTDTSKRAVFFSPETSTKSNAVFLSTREHGLGIADVNQGKIPSTVTEVKVFLRKNSDNEDNVPPLKRKLSRSDSIDLNQNTASNLFEGTEIIRSSSSVSVTKLKGGSVKNILSSNNNVPMSRSTYASPSVPNTRGDEAERDYTDAVLVTPSQCNCKKTKCLKLYVQTIFSNNFLQIIMLPHKYEEDIPR